MNEIEAPQLINSLWDMVNRMNLRCGDTGDVGAQVVRNMIDH